MKGLIKNNFYATLSGAKTLSIVMILTGAFIVAVISQTLLIAYIILGIIGFSETALAIVRDECSSKWGKCFRWPISLGGAGSLCRCCCRHCCWFCCRCARG